ncbi:MAG TPA: acyltransferase family protein [Gammaproteobacteria bacterium]
MERKPTYRPDIQGLRAIAVLLVIVYHAGASWLPGGFVGVDVFFVISGFLITSLLLREAARSGTVSLVDFYARRARRLLPAATLVIVATTLAASFVYSPITLKEYAYAAFASSLYASNIWFARASTDYFAADDGIESNPLLHTWSLGVEEQFYLVWPLLVLLAARSGGDVRRRLVITLMVIDVASFAGSVLLTRYSQPWAFFGSPTRAWEFAGGGLLALSESSRPSERARSALGVLGVLALALSAVLYYDGMSFPGTAAALPVIGSMLILLAGPGSATGRALSIRPMQFVGDMSYSLYLWHWPVLIFWPAAHKQLALVAIFAFSWATWRFVENPVRYRSLRLSSRALTAGLALTLCSSISAAGANAVAESYLRSPEYRTLVESIKAVARIYEDGCNTTLYESDPHACVYGAPDAERTMIVFGDSHAAHWFPALERIATEHGWRFVPLTKGACPSVFHEPYRPGFGRPFYECIEWRQRALAVIEEEHPDLLIVSNLERGATYWGDGQGIQQLLARVARISERVVVLRTVPRPSRDASECVFSACSVHLRPRPPIDLTYENVSTADVSDTICPVDPCPMVADGVMKYRDRHHLSAPYSQMLAPALARALGIY